MSPKDNEVPKGKQKAAVSFVVVPSITCDRGGKENVLTERFHKMLENLATYVANEIGITI